MQGSADQALANLRIGPFYENFCRYDVMCGTPQPLW